MALDADCRAAWPCPTNDKSSPQASPHCPPAGLLQHASQLDGPEISLYKFAGSICRPSPATMEPDAPSAEVQRQVLQSTLEEVALRHADSTSTDCCVICLDAIEEPCEVQPCGHRNFDYLCVLSWLHEQPSCPLCKASVRQVRHDTQDGTTTTTPIAQPPSATSKQLPSSSSRPVYGRYGRGAPHPRIWGDRGQARRQRRETVATRPNIADPILRRREIYQANRFSKHVGSNRLSRYRELTPQMFATDAELVSRARMFIRRELQVFSFLSSSTDDDDKEPPHSSQDRSRRQQQRASNAEFLLEYVVAILKSVDIMGSAGQAEDMLVDFLGRESTKLFLHELRAWLRSPYTKLEDWDRAVQYDDERTSSRGVVRDSTSAGIGAESSASRKPSHAARDGHGDHFKRKGDFYRPDPRSLESKRRRRGNSRYESFLARGP